MTDLLRHHTVYATIRVQQSAGGAGNPSTRGILAIAEKKGALPKLHRITTDGVYDIAPHRPL